MSILTARDLEDFLQEPGRELAHNDDAIGKLSVLARELQ